MPHPRNSHPFHEPLEAFERLLSQVGQRGVVIGGVAVSLLGKPRFTEGLDAMVLLSLEDVPHFLAIAEKVGIVPRIEQVEDFAARTRVLLLRHEPSQTAIDVSLGVLPFEQEVVRRSITHTLDGGLSLQLPTPEDLIIMKAVAHRRKDLLDIESIIQINPTLDRQRIHDWVTQFAALLEMPELWEDIADLF